ncbi:hypothetical protein BDN70DRAFT_189837 [Pholiota conissans]|uniref:Uncharacterized protein n=1 Tax=Pholiota conissans TaxID=109636 RepID=A0A9P6CXY8_9AGAR|nr:hypothetical protein BDN70DRAFT_189837 [Pholiota conissans]
MMPSQRALSSATLTFICMRCDRRSVYFNLKKHSVVGHHLLFLHDSIEVKAIKEVKGSEMERQLHNLNTHIVTLDQNVEKINMHLKDVAAVKSTMEDVVKMIGFKDNEELITASAICIDTQETRQTSLDDEEGVTTALSRSSDTASTKNAAHPSVGPADKAEISARMEQYNLRNRLEALETRVDSILTYHTALESKMDALEVNINQKLGDILALMREGTGILS